MRRNATSPILMLLATLWAWPAAGAEPPPQRQRELVRMVRQDCGSCHGMRLTGGLGPALTSEALAGKPVASLAATISDGRPGTPMPGWRALLGPGEADWIAQRLVAGFPQEPLAARREPR